jgi:membrane peptidoglycan carboxypeptidase
VESGIGRRVKSIGRPVAAKTGTTDDMRDAWFIGFTPCLVAGVWVGFDQERSLGKQEVGGRAAATACPPSASEGDCCLLSCCGAIFDRYESISGTYGFGKLAK